MGTFFSGLENSDSDATAYIWVISAYTTGLPQQIDSIHLPPPNQTAHIAYFPWGCIFNTMKTENNQQYKFKQRGDTMAGNKVQDYTEDKNEGHVDTREANFECENKDKNLGCDPGIDVAG